MKGRALIVPRSDGEKARRALADAGALRTDLSIRVDGEFLVLPIVADAPVPRGLGRETEEEFEPTAPTGPADYRDLLRWSEDERALLPRAFDVVGDLVLVRIPPALRSRSHEIGEALLAFVPGVRLVGADEGVHGVARRRTLRPLAGTGAWRTRHRENGIELEVDLERAYFSPRLAREHARVAAEVRRCDRVYDLCCGVGPFAATIARDGRAASIVAVDSNPEAIELLRATLRRVPNGAHVDARVVDVAEFVASAPPVERVILNLPHEGIKYLTSVARTVARRGRLYYYEVTPRTELERRGETIVRGFDRPGDWTALEPEVVHPYSPAADLAVFEFDRRDGPGEGP
jgi:tRNA (guanine37-N1)-methyltransferase